MEKNFNIEQHKLFSGLSNDQLSQVEKLLQVRNYKPDEIICQEGDRATDAYIIIDGKANVSKQKENSENTYDIVTLSSGAIIGEISFINRICHSATVKAITPVTIFTLSCDKLDALKNDKDSETQLIYYKIIENIASELCRRITYTNQILIDMMHSKKIEEDIRNAKMSMFAGFWSM